MTLYLKYRSQTLDELDLENVRESLKKIVVKGDIPHAFLFSGPKGTGKTSAARILAKIVNCENPPAGGEPCNICDQCISIAKGENLDVIELDAASHRGIDDIRALRDAVKLSPAKAKKKVYIIDEAHMLTTEASNALLKTLEEPPEHVMFILATTNPEKLIETIRSRATNVIFKKGSIVEIVRSLERVVKGEKIKAEKEALELIARESDGSFRDAIKLTEQLLMEGKSIAAPEVEEFLYNIKSFKVDEFLEILGRKDDKSALSEIEKSVALGFSVKSMTNLIIQRLREALMSEIGLNGNELRYFSKEELITLIKLMSASLSHIHTATLEQVPLEIVIVEWCQSEADRPLDDDKKIKNADTEKKSEVGGKSQAAQKSTEVKESDISENQVPPEVKKASNGDYDSDVIEKVWGRVLTEIRPRNASTEALLRASKPIDFDGKVLTLGVYYRFHKERLEANPHRDILEDGLETILGGRIRVVCTLTEPPVKKMEEKVELKTESSDASDVILTDSKDEDIIKVAKEIFGS
ncbi:DNA polymerase III, subunit gamma and tau [Candidatus Woesebacteria bacterium RIFCSPHIGHO2_01_FULL_39_32]|uniref:DNA polymerase III subunit gamma/tau n=2 Tax=Candidatus Woeseibacteriota TaxID=1752722 RepID=A0A0G0Q084_9BACT|nr:MAG: polymerase III, subunit gamma and tau protein [Candidatus Woesebacteria bacterium GW2011_GWA1_39_8]OGM03455.1 MAG: DNA polymerase III, subunit gamma and tau [Candidatus Woesebacteria bacterium GWB1_37_5]OGM23952.1 MAG: DNA polymerase III, subunit gamma and tau [Candidatus Woesebacteria bacterium RIFCSPHIGHO2_01_FULL_39_32]OGM37458.1 MAG: DNA polymerase III, subunit gamma and tau [Candidatus Woesebacteria bacterium RIFCSPHIGHO2_12_FULL_38_11]OGM64141.1 MAG: DNA polymerase III, subunit ga